MKNLFTFLLLLSFSAFFSCKGEQGDMGLPGQDGIDGTDGQDGQDGKDGQDGNANVISINSMISSTAWVQIAPDKYTLEFFVPQITQDIADNGLVMVYFKTSYIGLDGTTWTALPITIARSNYTESFVFGVKTGKIVFTNTSNDNNPGAISCPVRIILATSEGLARNPDLDWINYELVKETFQLPE